MKIVLSEDVFKISTTDDAWKLHKLLTFSCEGRHTIACTSPVLLEEWLSQIDAPTASAYRTAVNLSGRNSAVLPYNSATVFIKDTHSPVWNDPEAELSIDDALKLLKEPLGILLENSENDLFFLLGIMRPSERARMKRAIENRWAIPVHGGGSNIVAQLNKRLSQEFVGLRTFVLFDSDRRHSAELDLNWAPQSSESCQGYIVETVVRPKLPMRFWMLARRFIESYMPKSVLVKAPSQAGTPAAIEAFFRLSEHGRWFFNMKKGFNGDLAHENRHRSRDLYDGIDPEDKVQLENGFGSGLANLFGGAVENEFEWDNEALREASEKIPNLMRLL